MRRFLPVLFVAVVYPAIAADNTPADLQPLPEPPPPPAGQELSPDLEPQITIKQEGTNKVEEFRINGRLYMLRITPSHGKPYYLIDDRGDGKFTRQDNLDSGLRVPQWVLFTF